MEKVDQRLEKTLQKEVIQVTNKHTKRCSNSLVTEETQIKQRPLFSGLFTTDSVVLQS